MAGEPDKNGQIEVLRAIAILYTLVHHLPIAIGHLPKFYDWLYRYASFHVGVDLFFVISGYVITRSLCNSAAATQAPKWRLMAAFWLKRMFRLLPLAWLWLLLSAVYLVVISQLPGFREHEGVLLGPVLAAFLQVANLYAAYCIGGGPWVNAIACTVPNISAHYWSLSLEEQFYIFYPFLFFLLNRRLLVIALCICVAAQFFWFRPIGSYGWYFRTDALAWGVLLGFFANTTVYAASARWLSRYQRLLWAAMVLLIVLLPMVAARADAVGMHARHYGVGAIALVSAAIVLIASYDFKGPGNTGALYNAMLYIGARSYSLYVVHFLVFQIFGQAAVWILAGRTPGVGAGIAFSSALILFALFATFALSELSYRYVESRYRPRGRQLARRLLHV